MGPQTQTSQKQKAQPQVGLRPGAHPMSGHQWGVVMRCSLLGLASFGGWESLLGEEGHRDYNATTGSLGTRVRSTFESWSCYLCGFRQTTVPLGASLGSCVKQGRSSIYLTRSLPGLNEVINTKCLAQHLEHHLGSQKHYLLHHWVSRATPGTACFPASVREVVQTLKVETAVMLCGG